MKIGLGLSLAALMASGPLAAQAPSPAPKPFVAGEPLGVTNEGTRTPISRNVKVYGAIVSAESCVYDASRGLIVVPNRGAEQKEAPNDGFVSLLNHDGSVHTARWIGATRDGLVLNQPFGSDLQSGKLYLADSDGDTADGARRVAVVRLFDMATGTPVGELKVPDSPWLNDIAVAADGTVYGTQTVSPARVYKITPDGQASVLIEGAPLAAPNGIALDNRGNIVVVNVGDDAVLTFSPDGRLLTTEHAAQAGSDGLVIMADGTKYVSSVRMGGVSRIAPAKPAELIATGIPNAASMCYDSDANQLVIPMNQNSAVAFIRLP